MINRLDEGFVFTDNFARNDRQQDLEWKRQLEKAGLQLEEFDSAGQRQRGEYAPAPEVGNKSGMLFDSETVTHGVLNVLARQNIEIHPKLSVSGKVAAEIYPVTEGKSELYTSHAVLQEGVSKQADSMRKQDSLVRALRNASLDGVKFQHANLSLIEKDGEKILMLRDYFSEPHAVLEFVKSLLPQTQIKDLRINQVIINGVSYAVVNNELMQMEN